MTVNSLLTGPTVPPASGGPAKQAVVFLHGYGADGNDLIGLAPFFAEGLPDAAFFSPHAPESGEMGFGRQWFTLQGYDPDMLRRDPDRMTSVFERMYNGAVASTASLNAYIDDVLRELDLEAQDLALIGFSQGTMMAMHVGLRRSPDIGGIVGYSGALLGQDRLSDDRKAAPPILLVHGSADDVVPVVALAAMQRALDAAKVNYTAHIVPGHGHGIEQMGATLGRAFLRKNLVDRA
jgi:phospholipase/carboxylesterase